MRTYLAIHRLLSAITLALTLTACAAEVSHEAAEESDPSQQLASTTQALGCGCWLPFSGLYATFQVGNETFKQQITTASAIADAIAVWRGQSNKHIPVGQLACSCIGWNCQWSFRIKPETLTMAASAIELCDGSPSYVNANCSTFGGGSYCPWSAKLVELRDCRTNRACPLVPR